MTITTTNNGLNALELSTVVSGMRSSIETSKGIIKNLQKHPSEFTEQDTAYVEFLNGFIAGIETSIEVLTQSQLQHTKVLA